jgi:hypothetical protein
VGAPHWGAPSPGPPITLTQSSSLIFVLGWVVVWGRGEEGCSGEGWSYDDEPGPNSFQVV